MSKLISLFSFLFCGIICFSQINIRHDNVKKDQSISSRWGLKNNIWSHAHSEGSKKSLLDFDALENWQTFNDENLSISPDGKYFAYEIAGNIHFKKQPVVIVQSAMDSWQQSFLGANSGLFSADGRMYVFKFRDDLCFLKVSANQPEFIRAVNSHQFSERENPQWIAYQIKDSSSLVLQDLVSGKQKRFEEVDRYQFDKSGKWFVCESKRYEKELIIFQLSSGKEKIFRGVESFTFDNLGNALVLKTANGLKYVSIPSGESKDIFSLTDNAVKINNICLDASGKQVVFIEQKTSGKKVENSVWYYNTEMNRAMLKANNRTKGVDAGLSIQGPVTFTENGRYIQLSLVAATDVRKAGSNAVQLNIWSHQDSILQSTQPYLLKEKIYLYKAVIHPEAERIVRLENEEEKLGTFRLYGDFALVQKSRKEVTDRFWEKEYDSNRNWVVSLKDGSRRLLTTKAPSNNIWFSPTGKYLIYFDSEKQCQYFSYELQTGKTANISIGITGDQLKYKVIYEPQNPNNDCEGLAAWINHDDGVLIYDHNDIWQCDITGNKRPISLTNGYGFRNKTLFSLMVTDRKGFNRNLPVFGNGDTLLLRAFNSQNKYNGFFQKVLGSKGDPELLYMGPHFFDKLSGFGGLDNGMRPIKAMGSNTWIVKRQNAIEAPSYYLTSDFRNYKLLTNLQPHQKYNWITAELHSFKQLDGTISQGILYKPENFNQTKKYPVIISFYKDLSAQLYQYTKPAYMNSPNISDDPAWMVSHGYLVFAPDIYFTKDLWGPSTVNTIDGAASYLSRLPYVDSKRLGAVGHSNSGRFGYYLFTHTKYFAAMSIGSGFGGTNVISQALSIYKPGVNHERSALEWAESDASGTGLGNLWQNKLSWIDHTAVLNADKSNSPLLLFHNKKDGDDVMLAVQLYISLRRLNKKTWWLQYDEGGHIVWGKNIRDARDFTIRYTQFFDHYLKHAPAPGWMTQGIPYKLKGIEARYKLDATSSCSLTGKNHCYICEAWNKQYARTPEMFESEIKSWALDKDIQAELDGKTKVERARLDKEGEVENKRIVNILKYGYPEDNKAQQKSKSKK